MEKLVRSENRQGAKVTVRNSATDHVHTPGPKSDTPQSRVSSRVIFNTEPNKL